MNARRRNAGVGLVYGAATAWVEHALRQDSSLFTPGVPIWSSRWLGELRRRFLDNMDAAGGRFQQRLLTQLAGSPPQVYQLMGEVLYFHFLIASPNAIRGFAKRQIIDEVLAGSPTDPVAIPKDLVDALTPGIANPGTFFNTNRQYQIGFLIEFVQRWKELPAIEQERLLADPWGFKGFATGLQFQSVMMMRRGHSRASVQRESLLHLVFPDTFEGIVSSRHKQMIADTFAGLVAEPAGDIDRRLAQIRPAMAAKYGYTDDIYYSHPDVQVQWNPNVEPPDDLDTHQADTSLETLADELLWDAGELRKIIGGLEGNRQVIFQGPPGTGKTYAARSIAKWYQQQGGGHRIVQFHPSYAYEDFIQGFRPTLTDDGQAGFKLTDGPLLQMAKKAEANPDATYIIVIDEINRGNVPKVLGELYFLLEYRNEAITLQYSSESFRLPPNLWFIGTMNTTDRSIALVDAALRRRFYFFNFFPDQPPIQGLLRRWLQRKQPDAGWVANLLDAANRKLNDRQLGIGPSYFMKENLNEERVRFIWEQAVLPYIEEHFFGEEARLREFAYDELRPRLNAHPSSPDAGDDEDGAAGAASGQAEADDGDATA